MPKAIHSARHKKLTELLIAQRRHAGMTQAQVAKALGRHQPFITNIENGDRRLDIVELLDLAEILRLDLHAVIEELERIPSATERNRRRGKAP
jgi:transcriptional regulator with XRE-family HTH domain